MPGEQRGSNRGNIGLHALRRETFPPGDLRPQRHEILTLALEDASVAQWSVAWRHDRRAERLGFGQRFDPRRAVPVRHVVERPVDGRVAGEEDALLREPGEAITVRMPDTEVAKLDVMAAVVEDHDVAIQQ